MRATDSAALTYRGRPMDPSAEAFGELRHSGEILDDVDALRRRMQEDGYLWLDGLLDRDEVMAARQEITHRLARTGLLDLNHPTIEAIAKPGEVLRIGFRDLTVGNQPLLKVLYDGAMMNFFTRFLGGGVRHFDYTWFRAVPPGDKATTPHCDLVYMGRGTRNLFTAWTPIGDVPVEMGGLMILEGSHHHRDRLKKYLDRDVDRYCTNFPDAKLVESGTKLWQFDGALSKDPISLREKLGGRWLTADFRAGDVLVFPMFTVHASLDNHSNRVRLSSDSRYQLDSEPVDERWIGDDPPAHGPRAKRGMIC